MLCSMGKSQGSNSRYQVRKPDATPCCLRDRFVLWRFNSLRRDELGHNGCHVVFVTKFGEFQCPFTKRQVVDELKRSQVESCAADHSTQQSKSEGDQKMIRLINTRQ